jgi:hypothetical protein
MDDLKGEIIDALVETESANLFLPGKRLTEILSDAAVEECIRESGIETHLADDCIEAVRSGGHKILSTLIVCGKVELLADFVDHDRAQDTQLPFEKGHLCRIMKSTEAAFMFYEHQWATIPALFVEGITHRTYHQKTVLPFLRPVEPLGEGAFGTVSLVTLAGTQHRFTGLQRDGVRLSNRNKLLSPTA